MVWVYSEGVGEETVDSAVEWTLVILEIPQVILEMSEVILGADLLLLDGSD